MIPDMLSTSLLRDSRSLPEGVDVDSDISNEVLARYTVYNLIVFAWVTARKRAEIMCGIDERFVERNSGISYARLIYFRKTCHRIVIRNNLYD